MEKDKDQVKPLFPAIAVGPGILLLPKGCCLGSSPSKKGETNLTWQPFWPGRLQCPGVCPLGWQKTHGHCCWSPLCWNTPILLMEAGSWCGGQPAEDDETMSANYTGFTDSGLHVLLWWQRETAHLLPGQSDHVQRTVHETARHDLLGVLRKHSIIYTVVGSHVLSKERKKHMWRKVCCKWYGLIHKLSTLVWWMKISPKTRKELWTFGSHLLFSFKLF